MESGRRRIIVTRSPRETESVGEAMAARIHRGACVILSGGLGAGKTVFIRGACRGLGVDEDVLSPTFILCEAFAGRLPVIHADLYRLEHESEIEELGLFDLAGTDTVILAEWGERSETLMQGADIVVAIAAADDPGHRRITMTWTPAFDETFAGASPW